VLHWSLRSFSPNKLQIKGWDGDSAINVEGTGADKRSSTGNALAEKNH